MKDKDHPSIKRPGKIGALTDPKEAGARTTASAPPKTGDRQCHQPPSKSSPRPSAG